jgi:hypothetical protein
MAYTTLQIMAGISANISNIDTSDTPYIITNINKGINSVLRETPFESQIVEEVLPHPIRGDVPYLPAPTRLDRNRIIAMKKFGQSVKDFTRIYATNNEPVKNYNITTVNGTKVIEYRVEQGFSTLVSVGVDTWSTGTKSKEYSVYSSQSLYLALTGATTTTTELTSQSIDIQSGYQYVMPVYISNKDNVTSIELRLGNDSSNYKSMTKTTQFDGSAFVTGVNYLSFRWDDATTTGTVDSTAEYVAISVVHTADVNLYVSNITQTEVEQSYAVRFYARDFVIDGDGITRKNIIEDKQDSIDVNEDEFDLIVLSSTLETLKTLSNYGYSANGVQDTIYSRRLAKMIKEYQRHFPGLTQDISSQYYIL